MKKELEELTDRELDKEVAEKVFGFSPFREDLIDVVIADLKNNELCEVVPLGYSTNISDAWLVVEEMKKSHIFNISDTNSGYRVKFAQANISERFIQQEGEWFQAINKSAPRAICIASLKAIQAKGE